MTFFVSLKISIFLVSGTFHLQLDLNYNLQRASRIKLPFTVRLLISVP